MLLINVAAIVIVVLPWYHGFVLDEASVVAHAELVALCAREAALGRVIDLDGMLLREKGGGDTSVRLRHGVLVDHAAHVASVAWDFLAAFHVGRTTDPIGRILALSAIDVFVHLSAGRQVNMTVHALLQGHAAHVALDSA